MWNWSIFVHLYARASYSLIVVQLEYSFNLRGVARRERTHAHSTAMPHIWFVLGLEQSLWCVTVSRTSLAKYTSKKIVDTPTFVCPPHYPLRKLSASPLSSRWLPAEVSGQTLQCYTTSLQESSITTINHSGCVWSSMWVQYGKRYAKGTCGWCSNVAVLLTMPKVLTTRLIRLSEPSSCLFVEERSIGARRRFWYHCFVIACHSNAVELE